MLPRLRLIEIWNEPNLKYFFRFNEPTSLPKYKALIKAAYPRIKFANGSAVVIGGVGGPRSSTGERQHRRPGLAELAGAEERAKFDAYSQHIYPSVGPKFTARAANAFPIVGQPAGDLRDARPEEEGHEALHHRGRLHHRDDPLPAGQGHARGAEPVPEAQIFALPDVKSPRVAAVVWFNLQDNINWPGGLLFESRRPEAGVRHVRGRIAARPIPPLLRATLKP